MVRDLSRKPGELDTEKELNMFHGGCYEYSDSDKRSSKKRVKISPFDAILTTQVKVVRWADEAGARAQLTGK